VQALANSDAGQAARMTNPAGFANVRAHAEAHLRAMAAASMPGPAFLTHQPQAARGTRVSPPPPSAELHTMSAPTVLRAPREFPSRADERDGPGDHWVTIDGNHVLIHEPQGKGQPSAAQQPRRDHVTILYNSVAVTYAKGISDKDRDSALAAIKSAAALFNNHEGKLADEERKSIANIRTIDVDLTASRSSADVQTGTFHANAGQLAEGTARFATDIAHDSFHVLQWQTGRAYTGGLA
jgi:hypothetical protein